MSLIETALSKLKNGEAQSEQPRQPFLRQSSVLAAGKRKKIVIEGPKHHVAHADLIKSGVLTPLDHTVPTAEEFRRIKRPLIVNAFGVEPRVDRANVIMITSARPGAGKTFCAVNLALSMSLERDLNVLLVDADVAKPHVTRAFGLEKRPGLIDLLVDDGRTIGEMLVRTDLNDLQVLPAGRIHPHATELLASEYMSRVVQELATRYADRLIVMDSPPLLLTSESQALASQVGQITVVVEAGRTSQQELAQTLEVLDPTKAVSVVLNKSSRAWGRSGGHYGDYRHYGHEDGG